jgi:peptidoglycan/xylan/chitin deacetylase (PgdA/CDA1 family)
MLQRLALKIDVGSLRGAREGVPRLAEVLQRCGAGATFFVSLGPDRSGRQLLRAVPDGRPPGTPALAHYGARSLLHGTLLPAPDIAAHCGELLRGVRDAGFELGVQAWDRRQWQRQAAAADAAWTRAAMEQACERYHALFGEAPRCHAAAGWQTNPEALRLTQRLGFDYASDTRGRHPFVPVQRAELVHCPQLPTTLPPLDELLRFADVTEENAHQHLLALTQRRTPYGHVFTLRAEVEGMRLLPVFERLLEGWRDQGYQLIRLRDLYQVLLLDILPRHEVVRGRLEGCPGEISLQGEAFLAEQPAARAA